MRSYLGKIKNILNEKNWTLAVAESCTGGRLGDMITSFPGSSEYFLGGVIAYSNRVKSDLLNVSTELLENDGEVSPAAALAMARGVRELLGSSVGVATTGIAGPGGGSREKPVGLAYLAVATPRAEVVERFVFPGTRRKIKERAAETAISLALKTIE